MKSLKDVYDFVMKRLERLRHVKSSLLRFSKFKSYLCDKKNRGMMFSYMFLLNETPCI